MDDNDYLKGLAQPLEGKPTEKDPNRMPLAMWLPEMENFLTLRGLDDALTVDEDEGDIDAFDWDNAPVEILRRDMAARQWLLQGLSFQKKVVSTGASSFACGAGSLGGRGSLCRMWE
jgi:hypothetical protein